MLTNCSVQLFLNQFGATPTDVERCNQIRESQIYLMDSVSWCLTGVGIPCPHPISHTKGGAPWSGGGGGNGNSPFQSKDL